MIETDFEAIDVLQWSRARVSAEMPVTANSIAHSFASFNGAALL